MAAPGPSRPHTLDLMDRSPQSPLSLGDEALTNSNPKTPSQAQINQTKSLKGTKSHDFVSFFTHSRSASTEGSLGGSEGNAVNVGETNNQSTSGQRVHRVPSIVTSSTQDEYDTIDTSGVEKILENEGFHDPFSYLIPPHTTISGFNPIKENISRNNSNNNNNNDNNNNNNNNNYNYKTKQASSLIPTCPVIHQNEEVFESITSDSEHDPDSKTVGDNHKYVIRNENKRDLGNFNIYNGLEEKMCTIREDENELGYAKFACIDGREKNNGIMNDDAQPFQVFKYQFGPTSLTPRRFEHPPFYQVLNTHPYYTFNNVPAMQEVCVTPSASSEESLQRFDHVNENELLPSILTRNNVINNEHEDMENGESNQYHVNSQYQQQQQQQLNQRKNQENRGISQKLETLINSKNEQVIMQHQENKAVVSPSNNNEIIQEQSKKKGKKKGRLNDDAHNKYWLKGKCISYSCDPHGSRHLQTVLDTNSADAKRIRAMYIKEAVEDSKSNPSCLCEPILHPYGNYVVQRIIAYSEGEETTTILKVIKNYIFELSMNQHGTRSIQCLVEKLTEQSEYNLSISFNSFNIFLDSLKSHIASMICDNNGNHVINKILKSARTLDPKDNMFSRYAEIPLWFFKEFVDSCVKICNHQHGCCVYQNAIDRVVDDSNVFFGSVLVDIIADNCTNLIGDRYGNYVVQYCLGPKVEKLGLLYNYKGVRYTTCDMICWRLMDSTDIYELCKGKCQSNVIEQCVINASDDVRNEIIHRVLDRDDNSLLTLFTGEFSNYVVQTMVKMSDERTKDRIERLLIANPQLKSDVHVRGLLGLFQKRGRKRSTKRDRYHYGRIGNNNSNLV